jgi:hypothetical protein
MKEKLELIERIKQKKDKQSILLEQLAKFIKNEGRNYHLFIDEKTIVNKWNKDDIQYFLIKRETNEVVCYGTTIRLKHYMRIRNIKITDVMNDVPNFGDW